MSEAASAPGAATFSRSTVLALAFAGVFAFAALIVLSAYAPELRKGSDGGAHALSKSAAGFAAVVRLLQDTGAPVVVSRGAPPPNQSGALLVLTPAAMDDASSITAIAFAGPVLVILPKWALMPSRENPEWSNRLGVVPERLLTSNLVGKLAPGATLETGKGTIRSTLSWAGERTGRLGQAVLDQPRSLKGSGWTPVVIDQTGAVLMARHPEKALYILAEPDLLTTEGMDKLDQARLALDLINGVRPPGGGVVFDVTLNGYGRSRSLLKLAFQPPFLGATLCAALAALLMGWQAAIRFGAPLREGRAIALGKTALADNQAALIRMAKREHRMAPAYLALTREAVARSAGVSRALGGEALDAFLDRLGQKRSGHSIRKLNADAAQVGDPAGLMRLARALFEWKSEMTRERD